MSGGSLGFDVYEMKRGEIDGVQSRLDMAEQILAEALAAKFERYSAPQPTDDERMLAEYGAKILNAMLRELRSNIDQAARSVTSCAALWDVLDRIPSGDDSALHVHELALRVARARFSGDK